jgi:hypothetical protein
MYFKSITDAYKKVMKSKTGNNSKYPFIEYITDKFFCP